MTSLFWASVPADHQDSGSRILDQNEWHTLVHAWEIDDTWVQFLCFRMTTNLACSYTNVYIKYKHKFTIPNHCWKLQSGTTFAAPLRSASHHSASRHSRLLHVEAGPQKPGSRLVSNCDALGEASTLMQLAQNRTSHLMHPELNIKYRLTQDNMTICWSHVFDR